MIRLARGKKHRECVSPPGSAITTMEVAVLLPQQCWWYLLCVCLTAAKVVSAPAEAAGQEQCEVLDLNLLSTYSLPTNLTVKPRDPQWLLDFALWKEELHFACVRLQETGSWIQVMLFKDDCDHSTLENYNYLPRDSVPPRVWTTLSLDIKDNALLVTAPNGDSIQLQADSSSLLRDALYVSVARGVEAAVGCRVNCPLYRRTSEGPDKKTVKKSCKDYMLFYFRPGEEFLRLEYEVTYTTMEGNKEFLPITHIVPPDHLPKSLWLMVELQHLEGEVDVSLDYKRLKKEKLPQGCTFTHHTIRLVGDSHFSFFCNPSTGEVEGLEDDSWYCSNNTQSTNTQSSCKYPRGVVSTLVGLVVALLLLMVYLVRELRRRRTRRSIDRISTQYHKHHH